jgi:hypothetical protein
MIYLLLFIFIIFLYFYFNTYESFKNKNLQLNTVNKDEFKKYMIQKKDSDIYNVKLGNNIEDIKDCFKKCNIIDCIKLIKMTNNYDTCVKCQKDNSDKCYNNLISGGVCNNCSNNLKRFNCNDVNSSFSCPNPKNIYNNQGVKPYYLQVKNSKTISSPYDQSCLFCWNLKNKL